MIKFYYKSQWYRMCPIVCLFTGFCFNDTYYFGFISLKRKDDNE